MTDKRTKSVYLVPSCAWPSGCHKWCHAYMLAGTPVWRCEVCGLEVKRNAAGCVTWYMVGWSFVPARAKVEVP